MAHFPEFIDLTGRRCMIFGGGKIARRKIGILLRYEAHVEVVAREVLPEIREMVPGERIHLLDLEPLIRDDRLDRWIGESDLVIAATSDRETNLQISSWCNARHILVNVIDAPEECSFLFPSVVKKGEISIGINSDGKSPIVSKKVRQVIQEAVPDYYGDISRQLGKLKEWLKAECPEEIRRRAILTEVAAEAFSLERPLTKEELDKICSRLF